MISLETQLSTMSFEKEVSKFNKRDSPTAVNIKPEDVFHDVVDLVLTILFEDINDDFLNSFYLELLAALEIVVTDQLKFTPKCIS